MSSTWSHPPEPIFTNHGYRKMVSLLGKRDEDDGDDGYQRVLGCRSWPPAPPIRLSRTTPLQARLLSAMRWMAPFMMVRCADSGQLWAEGLELWDVHTVILGVL